MKKIVILLACGLVAPALVSPNLAHAGRVGRRQVRQQKRIHQGIMSGELTRRETGALEREQHHIQRAKRVALRDRQVTPREGFRIDRMQDRASRHIYRLKHNDISR